MRIFSIVIVIALACVTTNPAGRNEYSNVTAYAVPPYAQNARWQGTTPGGHPFADPGGLVKDWSKFDRLVARLNACVTKLPALNATDKKTNSCIQSIAVPGGAITDPQWIGFYVAPDAAPDRCTGVVTFPCAPDPRLCDKKPWLDPLILNRNPSWTQADIQQNCKCDRCRAMVQDSAVVVSWNIDDPTVASAFLGEVVRVETGCNDPWHLPFTQCLTSAGATSTAP